MRASRKNEVKLLALAARPELLVKMEGSALVCVDYSKEYAQVHKELGGRLYSRDGSATVGIVPSMKAYLRVGYYRTDTKLWNEWAFKPFVPGIEVALPYGRREVQLGKYPAVLRVTRQEIQGYVFVAGDRLKNVLLDAIAGILPAMEEARLTVFDPATGKKNVIRAMSAKVGNVRKGGPSVWDFRLAEPGTVPDLGEAGDVGLPGAASGRDGTIYRTERFGEWTLPVAKLGDSSSLWRLYEARGWRKAGRDVYWRPDRKVQGMAEVVSWTDPVPYLEERVDALARRLGQADTEALYGVFADWVRANPRPAVYGFTYTAARVAREPERVAAEVAAAIVADLRAAFNKIAAEGRHAPETVPATKASGTPA